MFARILLAVVGPTLLPRRRSASSAHKSANMAKVGIVGSVTRITDSSQATVNTYRYDGWGRATTESGTLANPFRFTGRERDSGTPLYYYRARTYDSDTGRFTSKDPAGMVDGPNLYNYGGGNPVGRVDPSGRWFEGCSGWECRASPGSPPPATGGGPRPGPSPGLCASKWVGVGAAFIVLLLTLIFGFAAIQTEQAALPVLVVMTGFGIGGALVDMTADLVAGNLGGVLGILGDVF